MHTIVEVEAGPNPDLIGDRLWVLGAVGVEERDGLVIGSFSGHEGAHQAAAELGGVLRTVDDRTGIDAWRDHATTYEIGDFLIRPPWIGPAGATADHEIVIDPGDAFGSGSHPSTRLAAELLIDFVRPGMKVADLGAGSGVLAVLAAHLGAQVTAVDTDPAAIPAIDANAARNKVSDRVRSIHGDASATAFSAELVVLNVTIDLHEALAAGVGRHHGGPLIVAGILAGDQEERCATAHRRSATQRRVDGEWAGLLLDHASLDHASLDHGGSQSPS